MGVEGVFQHVQEDLRNYMGKRQQSKSVEVGVPKEIKF